MRLEVMRDDNWEEVQRQPVNEIGWSALFRLEGWDTNRDVRYRLRHGAEASFEGIIRKDPINKSEIRLAAFSCNSNKDRGDRANYIRNVNFHDPDLLFFAGDQSYDHKEHTAAWLKFGWQFKELFRNRPCITIPDDHDIGQGNLWGENGKVAEARAGHDGGYFYDADYVKMVERCQTAHLPDPLRWGTGRARDRGVLYKSFGGWCRFCHYRRPQVQKRSVRQDPPTRPKTRPY